MARPTEYSEEIGNIICSRIASGESLRRICKDEGMPDKATVFRWLLNKVSDFDTFRDQYALSRQMQAECLADEIMDIADDGSNDYLEDDESFVKFNAEAVARSRLRVDTRKWYLSKVLPKFKDKPEEVPITQPIHIEIVNPYASDTAN